MLDLLRDRTYRHLFAAQVTALLGTGFLTIALGLLAYDLAEVGAGTVLGTIFTLKMVIYVTLAPVAGAFADRLPRRALLVGLDLVRASTALALPFVTETWQVYALVAVLFAASAAFTPAYQATLPDILPEEARYTRALSLSRLAYDLENILSPALAGLVLLAFAYDALFFGTLAGFTASAALILTVTLPRVDPAPARGIWDRTTRGIRIYLATPRLRGLLALNLAAAAGGAMVIVNTYVLVLSHLGLGENAVALALGAFGAGSMASALILPRLLDRTGDRPVMLAGAVVLCAALAGLAAVGLSWPGVLIAWLIAGLGYSAVLTPSGRLIRRSAQPADRPAVFAAQFALSHACWLIAYPTAGFVMTRAGPTAALTALAGLALAGILFATRLWPRDDPRIVPHEHPDLPPDHPHLAGHGPHAHEIRFDALHHEWPRQG